MAELPVETQVSFGRHPVPVTPWRRELQELSHRMVSFIRQHAEPEEAFRVARDVADDVVYETKRHLRSTYGRVFDPIFDGTEKIDQFHEVNGVGDKGDHAAAIVALLRERPGIRLIELTIGLYGRNNSATRSRVNAGLAELGPKVGRTGLGTRNNPFRYSLV